MKRLLLFAVVLVLVVSLVPLSGVSAQRPAPAASASSAPAAQVTYYKQIKTQQMMYCGGLKCFKYVQKLYWGYNYSQIVSWAATMKGVVFQTVMTYNGWVLKSAQGGAGYPYYFRYTKGDFDHSTYGRYYINIMQFVYADGTWWKAKEWYGTG